MDGALRNRSISLLLVTALGVTALVATPDAGDFARNTTARAAVDPALLAQRGDRIAVIVQKRDAFDLTPERTLARLGVRLTRALPIVDGFAALMPADALPSLARLPMVRAISLDRDVRVSGTGSSSTLKSVFPKSVRADQLWRNGVTGRGVTVALIDTGVADVADLSGRVLPVYDDITATWSPCLNLTGEPDCRDSYGHGTFLAGIIAGDGASSGGAWTGVAPEANLVSIKIAGRDGAADVSTLLAAIQWVVSFKDRYGIRVLNLSLGTDSTQSYRSDPLNYAVERAWASGIAVVVSASNRGPDAGTISKPGDDPWVITVGATDDMVTPGLGDDMLPDFSSRGPTAADGIAKPDIVAPGAHIISLRAPGSEIDTRFPYYIDGAYRKGSGTSMSAAAVSGIVALMLQADPGMAPDRAKFALTSTARSAGSSDPLEVGAGVPDAYRAAFDAPAGTANQGLDRSTGLGSLDASRGSVHVQMDDPVGTVVSGSMTAQMLVWDPIGYTSGDWDGAKWYGAKWYGAKWYGAKWYASTWNGAKWYGAKWYGQTDGAKWYGAEWQGAKWYGAWE